jgi:flagellar biosynthesis component FlhA
VGVFGDNEWRERFSRVFRMGFSRIEFMAILCGIILPIVTLLLDMLIFPYFAARVLCLFATESYVKRTLFVRFSFLACCMLKLAWKGVGSLKVAVINLHNEIRDSRYLLGTELKNR